MLGGSPQLPQPLSHNNAMAISDQLGALSPAAQHHHHAGGGVLAEDCSSNDLPEWEMVDNVRPLRTKIIESVRGMPSYYEGRIKKDPIKLKQFEMTMNSDAAQ